MPSNQQGLTRQSINLSQLPSEQERAMLRDSLRGFLEQSWPADKALQLAKDGLDGFWAALAEQGLASLGSDPYEGGLQEILTAFEELGRAACPAPLLGAVLLNLIAGNTSSPALDPLLVALRQGELRVSFSFAGFDGDANA